MSRGPFAVDPFFLPVAWTEAGRTLFVSVKKA